MRILIAEDDPAEARFSHGICPDCYERVAHTQLEKMRCTRQAAESPEAAS